jgi:hypothetical protein
VAPRLDRDAVSGLDVMMLRDDRERAAVVERDGVLPGAMVRGALTLDQRADLRARRSPWAAASPGVPPVAAPVPVLGSMAAARTSCTVPYWIEITVLPGVAVPPWVPAPRDRQATTTASTRRVF